MKKSIKDYETDKTVRIKDREQTTFGMIFSLTQQVRLSDYGF